MMIENDHSFEGYGGPRFTSYHIKKNPNPVVIRHTHASDEWRLRAPFHFSHLLRELVKGPEEDRFYDVELWTAEGDLFRAHKLVLLLASPYFRGRFRMEGPSDVLRFGAEVTSVGLRNFLEYAYEDELVLEVESVVDVYKCADFFVVEELAEAARYFLINHLSVDNAVEVLAFARDHSVPDLGSKAEDLIRDNLFEDAILDGLVERGLFATVLDLNDADCVAEDAAPAATGDGNANPPYQRWRAWRTLCKRLAASKRIPLEAARFIEEENSADWFEIYRRIRRGKVAEVENWTTMSCVDEVVVPTDITENLSRFSFHPDEPVAAGWDPSRPNVVLFRLDSSQYRWQVDFESGKDIESVTFHENIMFVLRGTPSRNLGSAGNRGVRGLSDMIVEKVDWTEEKIVDSERLPGMFQRPTRLKGTKLHYFGLRWQNFEVRGKYLVVPLYDESDLSGLNVKFFDFVGGLTCNLTIKVPKSRGGLISGDHHLDCGFDCDGFNVLAWDEFYRYSDGRMVSKRIAEIGGLLEAYVLRGMTAYVLDPHSCVLYDLSPDEPVRLRTFNIDDAKISPPNVFEFRSFIIKPYRGCEGLFLVLKDVAPEFGRDKSSFWLLETEKMMRETKEYKIGSCQVPIERSIPFRSVTQMEFRPYGLVVWGIEKEEDLAGKVKRMVRFRFNPQIDLKT